MENYQVLKLTNRRFSEFYLCYCGYEDCKPGHYYGPAVRANYLIHYITKGKGIFRVHQKEYQLSAGQGFLVFPDIQTFYQADPDDPWSYCWIGFDGNNAVRYLTDCGLTTENFVFNCSDGERLCSIVKQMLQSTKVTIPANFHLQGLLYEFFSILSGSQKSLSALVSDDENIYVLHAVEYIQNKYSFPIHVADVASHVGVTRSYLYTLFQNTLSISPQEFITNCRISRARELLTYSDLSIQTIAISCGYSGSMALSKAFKAKEHIAPGEYRRRHRITAISSTKE